MTVEQMTVEQAFRPSAMTRPSAITGRVAQWAGLLMLCETYALIALLCLR